MTMRKLLVVSAGCAGLVLAIALVSCGAPWQTPDSEVLATGTKSNTPAQPVDIVGDQARQTEADGRHTPGLPGDGELQLTLDYTQIETFWQDLYSEECEAAGRTQSRDPGYVIELLAKAEPDECFFGVGDPLNQYPFDFDTQTCDGMPKVNQAYVWGMVKEGDNVWLGTAANMLCTVPGLLSIAMGDMTGGFGSEDVMAMSNRVACEYGEGVYGQGLGLPEFLGDWRPPEIFAYNTATDTLEQKVPGDALLAETWGVRGAAAADNVVFMGGPNLAGMSQPSPTAALNMWAFNATTGALIGTHTFQEYTDIRKWALIDGELYAGVANNPFFPPNLVGGSILHWIGSEADPFQFEVVGNITDGYPAYLAEHEGRLFATTWAHFDSQGASLWMSPVIQAGGLTTADADSWERVWVATDYEPDPVTAQTYLGGALHSFDGYLYWGVMFVPMMGASSHMMAYSIDNDLHMAAAMLGSFRPISIFRGRDFGTRAEEKEVVYGLPFMPACLPLEGGGCPLGWKIKKNKMGPPIAGLAGFGNFFNTYTWAMAADEDGLYVGTFDWSFIMHFMIEQFEAEYGPLPDFELPCFYAGADLYRIRTGDAGAIPVDLAGLDNWSSYGVRFMDMDEDELYLGMANPMNLMTDLTDDEPEGGWELLRLLHPDCNLAADLGDFNDDGVVDYSNDFGDFIDCFTGPGWPVPCTPALYDDPCCSIGDFDADGDVDASDLFEMYRLLGWI